MKNILIPTDFSDNAWDALLYAIRLYDTVPAHFYILHTYQAGTSRTSNRMSKYRDTHLHRVLKDESEKGLKKIQRYLDENLLNDDHKYQTISQAGDLVFQIKQVVANYNIDIIVMGTTGATGAKEIFMGSNAVSVINHIELCPVLTVPKDYEFTELKNIMFATDLKKKFSSIELDCLLELQTIHDSKINLLYVKEYYGLNENQLYNLIEIKALFKDNPATFLETELKDKVAKTIINYCEKNEVDLVCLVNSEKKFLKKLMEENVIKKMSFHSAIPLLIIPI
ncbi:universal stress protein [Aureibaculum sp. A20]|uniref:Universal stress protein n=1 Tax=Aureibaculum flavum TaxID=2795986 RepID=A0ABS0WLN2_9FLAO|nr:universal stress protein [Aureibaculum flavum]MBJ2172883.1 universal stress protein [Aureibaculum flavum]